ncbi:MAG: methyltransferase domain-containing protein, partial [Candidatus Omnitrophica bacterium]|nr:methyltransferase domain-containing protein [Candidatus Omnitrophota bacterium]
MNRKVEAYTFVDEVAKVFIDALNHPPAFSIDNVIINLQRNHVSELIEGAVDDLLNFRLRIARIGCLDSSRIVKKRFARRAAKRIKEGYAPVNAKKIPGALPTDMSGRRPDDSAAPKQIREGRILAGALYCITAIVGGVFALAVYAVFEAPLRYILGKVTGSPRAPPTVAVACAGVLGAAMKLPLTKWMVLVIVVSFVPFVFISIVTIIYGVKRYSWFPFNFIILPSWVTLISVVLLVQDFTILLTLGPLLGGTSLFVEVVMMDALLKSRKLDFCATASGAAQENMHYALRILKCDSLEFLEPNIPLKALETISMMVCRNKQLATRENQGPILRILIFGDDYSYRLNALKAKACFNLANPALATPQDEAVVKAILERYGFRLRTDHPKDSDQLMYREALYTLLSFVMAGRAFATEENKEIYVGEMLRRHQGLPECFLRPREEFFFDCLPFIANLCAGFYQYLRERIDKEFSQMEKAGRLSPENIAFLRQELIEKLIPGLRVLEAIFKETTPVGTETHLKISYDVINQYNQYVLGNTPSKTKLELVTDIPISTLLIPTVDAGGNTEIRVQPGYLPITVRNMLHYIKSGILQPVNMQRVNGQDLAFYPAYHTSLQGRLKKHAITLLALGYNAGYFATPKEESVDRTPEKLGRDTLAYPGVYNYEGVTYDIYTGVASGCGQTNIYTQQTLGARSEEGDYLSFPLDLASNVYFATAISAYLRKEPSDLKAIYANFRQQLRKCLRYLGLKRSEMRRILAGTYFYFPLPGFVYKYHRRYYIKAITSLQKAIARDRCNPGSPNALRALVEITQKKIKETLFKGKLAQDIADAVMSRQMAVEDIVPYLLQETRKPDSTISAEARRLLRAAQGVDSDNHGSSSCGAGRGGRHKGPSRDAHYRQMAPFGGRKWGYVWQCELGGLYGGTRLFNHTNRQLGEGAAPAGPHSPTVPIRMETVSEVIRTVGLVILVALGMWLIGALFPHPGAGAMGGKRIVPGEASPIALQIITAVIATVFIMLFSGKEGYGAAGIGKSDIKTGKDVLAAKKVKPYAEAWRKAEICIKRYVAYLYQKFMQVYRYKAAVAYHRKSLFASFIIKTGSLCVYSGKKRGCGTGIPMGLPYFLVISLSILTMSSPALIGNILPAATKIYGYLPPYLSTIASKCSLIQTSLSIFLAFMLITSCLNYTIPSTKCQVKTILASPMLALILGITAIALIFGGSHHGAGAVACAMAVPMLPLGQREKDTHGQFPACPDRSRRTGTVPSSGAVGARHTDGGKIGCIPNIPGFALVGFAVFNIIRAYLVASGRIGAGPPAASLTELPRQASLSFGISPLILTVIILAAISIALTVAFLRKKGISLQALIQLAKKGLTDSQKHLSHNFFIHSRPKTVPFMARMVFGRSVFRTGKPRASARRCFILKWLRKLSAMLLSAMLLRAPLAGGILTMELLGHLPMAKIRKIALEEVSLLSRIVPDTIAERGSPTVGFYLAGPAANLCVILLSIISLHYLVASSALTLLFSVILYYLLISNIIVFLAELIGFFFNKGDFFKAYTVYCQRYPRRLPFIEEADNDLERKEKAALLAHLKSGFESRLRETGEISPTLIDIGAGYGMITSGLIPLFSRTIAVEENPYRAGKLREIQQHGFRLEVYEGDFLGYKPKEEFSAALISHVLFLMSRQERDRLINNAIAMIKPGGWLVIVLNSITSRIGNHVHFREYMHTRNNLIRGTLDTVEGRLKRAGYAVTTERLEVLHQRQCPEEMANLISLVLRPQDRARRKKILQYVKTFLKTPQGYEFCSGQEILWVNISNPAIILNSANADGNPLSAEREPSTNFLDNLLEELSRRGLTDPVVQQTARTIFSDKLRQESPDPLELELYEARRIVCGVSPLLTPSANKEQWISILKHLSAGGVSESTAESPPDASPVPTPVIVKMGGILAAAGVLTVTHWKELPPDLKTALIIFLAWGAVWLLYSLARFILRRPAPVPAQELPLSVRWLPGETPADTLDGQKRKLALTIATKRGNKIYVDWKATGGEGEAEKSGDFGLKLEFRPPEKFDMEITLDGNINNALIFGRGEDGRVNARVHPKLLLVQPEFLAMVTCVILLRAAFASASSQEIYQKFIFKVTRSKTLRKTLVYLRESKGKLGMAWEGRRFSQHICTWYYLMMAVFAYAIYASYSYYLSHPGLFLSRPSHAPLVLFFIGLFIAVDIGLKLLFRKYAVDKGDFLELLPMDTLKPRFAYVVHLMTHKEVFIRTLACVLALIWALVEIFILKAPLSSHYFFIIFLPAAFLAELFDIYVLNSGRGITDYIKTKKRIFNFTDAVFYFALIYALGSYLIKPLLGVPLADLFSVFSGLFVSQPAAGAVMRQAGIASGAGPAVIVAVIIVAVIFNAVFRNNRNVSHRVLYSEHLTMLGEKGRKIFLRRLRWIGRRDLHSRCRWQKDLVWLAALRRAQAHPEAIDLSCITGQLQDNGKIDPGQVQKLKDELGRQERGGKERLLQGRAILCYGYEVRWDPVTGRFLVTQAQALKGDSQTILCIRGPPRQVAFCTLFISLILILLHSPLPLVLALNIIAHSWANQRSLPYQLQPAALTNYPQPETTNLQALLGLLHWRADSVNRIQPTRLDGLGAGGSQTNEFPQGEGAAAVPLEPTVPNNLETVSNVIRTVRLVILVALGMWLIGALFPHPGAGVMACALPMIWRYPSPSEGSGGEVRADKDSSAAAAGRSQGVETGGTSPEGQASGAAGAEERVRELINRQPFGHYFFQKVGVRNAADRGKPNKPAPLFFAKIYNHLVLWFGKVKALRFSLGNVFSGVVSVPKFSGFRIAFEKGNLRVFLSHLLPLLAVISLFCLIHWPGSNHINNIFALESGYIKQIPAGISLAVYPIQSIFSLSRYWLIIADFFNFLRSNIVPGDMLNIPFVPFKAGYIQFLLLLYIGFYSIRYFLSCQEEKPLDVNAPQIAAHSPIAAMAAHLAILYAKVPYGQVLPQTVLAGVIPTFPWWIIVLVLAAIACYFLPKTKLLSKLVLSSQDFNEFGLALTRKGEQKALKSYQRALNIFVKECQNGVVVEGIRKRLNVCYFGGSFARRRARLGIYRDRSGLKFENVLWMQTMGKELYKDSGSQLFPPLCPFPSDLDVCSVIHNRHAMRKPAIYNAVSEIQKKIFRKTGIFIQVLLATPDEFREIAGTSYPISILLGRGLIENRENREIRDRHHLSKPGGAGRGGRQKGTFRIIPLIALAILVVVAASALGYFGGWAGLCSAAQNYWLEVAGSFQSSAIGAMASSPFLFGLAGMAVAGKPGNDSAAAAAAGGAKKKVKNNPKAIMPREKTEAAWSYCARQGWLFVTVRADFEAIGKFWRKALIEIARYKPCARILDICTGNLVIPLIAKQICNKFTLTAIDTAEINPYSIRSSQGINFHRRPAGATGFPNKSFDVITGNFALECAGAEEALREANRVLEKDGEGVFVLYRDDSPIINEMFQAVKSAARACEDNLFATALKYAKTQNPALKERLIQQGRRFQNTGDSISQAIWKFIDSVLRNKYPAQFSTAEEFTASIKEMIEMNSLVAKSLVKDGHIFKENEITGLFSRFGFEIVSLEPINVLNAVSVGWGVRVRKARNFRSAALNLSAGAGRSVRQKGAFRIIPLITLAILVVIAASALGYFGGWAGLCSAAQSYWLEVAGSFHGLRAGALAGLPLFGLAGMAVAGKPGNDSAAAAGGPVNGRQFTHNLSNGKGIEGNGPSVASVVPAGAPLSAALAGIGSMLAMGMVVPGGSKSRRAAETGQVALGKDNLLKTQSSGRLEILQFMLCFVCSLILPQAILSDPVTIGMFIIQVFIFLPIVAVTEEILFRKLLFKDWLVKKGCLGTKAAMLLSSLIFSLLHAPMFSIGFIPRFLGGILTSCLYVKERSLLYPILLHLLWDIFCKLGIMGMFNISAAYFALTILVMMIILFYPRAKDVLLFERWIRSPESIIVRKIEHLPDRADTGTGARRKGFIFTTSSGDTTLNPGGAGGGGRQQGGGRVSPSYVDWDGQTEVLDGCPGANRVFGPIFCGRPLMKFHHADMGGRGPAGAAAAEDDRRRSFNASTEVEPWIIRKLKEKAGIEIRAGPEPGLYQIYPLDGLNKPLHSSDIIPETNCCVASNNFLFVSRGTWQRYAPKLEKFQENILICNLIRRKDGHLDFANGESTRLAIRTLEANKELIRDEICLDAGSGQDAVLAMVDSRLGAKRILAIERERACALRSREFLALNGITNVNVIIKDFADLDEVDGIGNVNVVQANISAYELAKNKDGECLDINWHQYLTSKIFPSVYFLCGVYTGAFVYKNVEERMIAEGWKIFFSWAQGKNLAMVLKNNADFLNVSKQDLLELNPLFTQRESSLVSRLAGLIAREAGLSKKFQNFVERAGLVHDLGKGHPIICWYFNSDARPERWVNEALALLHAELTIDVLERTGIRLEPWQVKVLQHHSYDMLWGNKEALWRRCWTILILADHIISRHLPRLHREKLPQQYDPEKIISFVHDSFDVQIGIYSDGTAVLPEADHDLIEVIAHLLENEEFIDLIFMAMFGDEYSNSKLDRYMIIEGWRGCGKYSEKDRLRFYSIQARRNGRYRPSALGYAYSRGRHLHDSCLSDGQPWLGYCSHLGCDLPAVVSSLRASSPNSSPFRILDYGCGSAVAVSELGSELGLKEVFGVDLTAPADITGEVKIVQSVIEKTSFPDNYFNFIMTVMTLSMQFNPIEAIEEIYRILCPGGEAIIEFTRLELLTVDKRPFPVAWISAYLKNLGLDVNFSMRNLYPGEKCSPYVYVHIKKSDSTRRLLLPLRLRRIVPERVAGIMTHIHYDFDLFPGVNNNDKKGVSIFSWAQCAAAGGGRSKRPRWPIRYRDDGESIIDPVNFLCRPGLPWAHHSDGAAAAGRSQGVETGGTSPEGQASGAAGAKTFNKDVNDRKIECAPNKDAAPKKIGGQGLGAQANFLKRNLLKSGFIAKALDRVEYLNPGYFALGVIIAGYAFGKVFGGNSSFLKSYIESVYFWIISNAHFSSLSEIININCNYNNLIWLFREYGLYLFSFIVFVIPFFIVCKILTTFKASQVRGPPSGTTNCLGDFYLICASERELFLRVLTQTYRLRNIIHILIYSIKTTISQAKSARRGVLAISWILAIILLWPYLAALLHYPGAEAMVCSPFLFGLVGMAVAGKAGDDSAAAAGRGGQAENYKPSEAEASGCAVRGGRQVVFPLDKEFVL